MSVGESPLLALAGALCVGGCGLALLGEWRGQFLARLAGKASAGGSYCCAAWLLGAGERAWSTWLLAGMLACWAGDLLLVAERRPRVFLAGLAAFLLGHVAYGVAFWSRGQSLDGIVPAAVLMTGFSWAVLRWLWPHLDGKFRAAVPAYVVAISVMMVLAAGSFAARVSVALLLGALLFVLSDLTVARHRFVAQDLRNRVVGLPLYFAGQWLLAWSVLS